MAKNEDKQAEATKLADKLTDICNQPFTIISHGDYPLSAKEIIELLKQAIPALNARQPCETCGGSKVIVERISTNGHREHRTCPDCPPDAGELVKELENIIANAMHEGRATGYILDEDEVAILKQAVSALGRLQKRLGKLEKRIAAASTKLSDYFVMFPRDRDKSDELIYQAKAALGKDKDDNAV